MTALVAVLGALITILGLLGLVQPERFRGLFTVLGSQARFILAIAARLGMGVLLLWLADELRHPQVIRILAVIGFVAAAGVLLMGRERLDRLVDWWLARPDGILRVSAAFAGAFGAFLIYAAI